MQRRKKLVNASEAATQRILDVAAERNAARVFTKMRIADVLEVNNSGISNEMFSYALKAHFDFVVADQDHMPLFAVEFDGPTHTQDHATRQRDLMKNALCDRLGLPLARVTDEHVFKKARGIDYVTWLTEMYFGYEALCRAQEEGQFPEDEPADPMSFVSLPGLPGSFPLFVSARARISLRKRYEAKQLATAVPTVLSGYDETGRAHVITLIPLVAGGLVISEGDIYLRGFGIAPAEAAEEIAVVNLDLLVGEQLKAGGNGVSAKIARGLVVKFLREHRVESFGLTLGVDLGFGLRFHRDDNAACWVVGALGDDPEQRIALTRK